MSPRLTHGQRGSDASNDSECCQVTDQINTLVYVMGDQADDILDALHVPDDANYDQLKQSLNAYFGVRYNLIFERAKFNRRVQQPGESVDDPGPHHSTVHVTIVRKLVILDQFVGAS